MYLVLVIVQDFIPPTSQQTQINRSYLSKEEILKHFLKTHSSGEIITESPKLIAYGHHITGSEVLAVNRKGGHSHTLEVLHIDQVKEI